MENAVNKKISEWKVVEKKQKKSLTYFWGKASQKPQKEKTGVPTMVQRVVSSENSGSSGPVSVVTLDETPSSSDTAKCSKSKRNSIRRDSKGFEMSESQNWQNSMMTHEKNLLVAAPFWSQEGFQRLIMIV